jgi:hypothetical protein
VQWPPSDVTEATRFIQFADRERLFPLLLEEPAHPGAIAEALPRFSALGALHRKKYELSREAMIRLIDVAGPNSFAVLKGSDYRFRLYSKPVLRPLADIDFLVPRRDVHRVARNLAEAGHEQVHASHGASWSPGFHEYQCVIEHMNAELHHAFMQPIRARIPYEAIWQRREPFEGDGYNAFRLDFVDSMLHHAVSLAKDEFSATLIRYVDMYLFVRHPACNLLAVVESAREWQTEAALYGALQLTRSLFPEAHDGAVNTAMSALLTKRRRTFLSGKVLPDPRLEASGHLHGRLTQLWRKFWLMDVMWRRFAFFAVHMITSVAGYSREWLSRRTRAAVSSQI